jgi:hypothetical protein
MKNILTAIATKISNSSLFSDVGGRIYLDQAPAGCELPYIVYSVITAPKEKTFTEVYRNSLIQFSIFSSSPSAVEISGIYDSLTTLLDDSSFSITGSDLVWCKESNLTTITEDITTPEGTQAMKAWHVDFEVKTSLN